MIEPNTFVNAPTESLMAGLMGTRDGSVVFLRKIYSDFKSPVLHYEGTVNEDLTRISGTWIFPSLLHHGRFMMVRDAGRRRATTVTTDQAIDTLV